MLEHRGSEFLLGTLLQGRVFQQKLDLEFARGESVTFYLVGKGTSVRICISVMLTLRNALRESWDRYSFCSADNFECVSLLI